jgi:hypothetical protein
MGQIIFRLFFYGAIALVPDGIRNSTEMTAYLLNVTGDCKHIPLLTFEKKGGSMCGELPEGQCADPISSNKTCCGELELGLRTYCICKLIDEKIVLDPAPERIQKNFKLRPGSDLPDPGAEDDFAWLLRIANIDSQANRAKASSSILRMNPKSVEAYIDFSWGEAKACHIDQNLSKMGYEIDMFEFRDADGQNPSAHVQALAEYVEFSGFLDAKPVHVLLESISGKPHAPIRILLDCSNKSCPDLFISNSLSGDNCKDEDVGRHFTHYYNLSASKGLGLIPYRTGEKRIVGEEYSCGPNSAPPLPGESRFTMHPLAELRSSLAKQLKKILCGPGDARVAVADLVKLDGVVRVFGNGSGKLENSIAKILANKGCLHGQDPEVIKLLNEWLKGIASRVICPMAMFDP